MIEKGLFGHNACLFLRYASPEEPFLALGFPIASAEVSDSGQAINLPGKSVELSLDLAECASLKEGDYPRVTMR